jgi:outer membrane lipoprotein-sorting protein
VPAGAVVAVAAVVAGTTVAGAQAAPALPARSAAQLIADVQQSGGPGPMTATIQLIANLGLPALPGSGASGASGDSPSALSLLSGTHTANIWYADPQHVRIAEPVQLGESDLRRDGQQLWLWDSRNQTATHVLLPAAGRFSGPRRPAATPRPGGTMPTPQQVARQILAAVGPTTTVSVQRNVEVAGQAAYQVSLAPKTTSSLVGQVRIAIDAAKSFPLRVQVFARGSASPAFQLGFTSLSFGRPAASNFTFTPPAGAKVKTIKVPSRPPLIHGPGASLKDTSLPLGDRSVIVRSRGGRIRLLPPRSMPGKVVVLQPGTGKRTVIVHGHILRAAGHGKNSQRHSDRQLKPAQRAPSGSLLAKPWTPGAAGLAGPLLGRPQVLGKDWLSVLVIRPGVTQRVVVGRPEHVRPSAGASGSASTIISSGGTISSTAGPAGPAMSGIAGMAGPAILRALLKSATPVHGAWGSGQLLRTSLVSVLITSKGTVLLGAVTPAVLYADAAQVK